MNNLTPQEGSTRQYGYFECKRCNRKWESGCSWTGIGQKCILCKAMVNPYKQKPLEQDFDDPNNVHVQRLCGKCIQLGYCCKLKKSN